MLEKIDISQITVGLYADGWQDAIAKAAQPLIRQKKIEPRYVHAMIEAIEKLGPYIVLGKHVALAHARPECGVNEKGIHFTVLNPPVSFGSEKFDPVRLLITLAATDSESHLELLGELAAVLAEEENIIALSDCSNAEEFLALLRKFQGEL